MKSKTLEIYDSSRLPPAFLRELVDLVRYRDLVLELVIRNVKTRYKRSVLGILWTMVNPLLMMLVLTLVFSNLFRFAVGNYAVYILSGLVIWNLLAESTTDALGEMIYGGQLFSRIYAPKAVSAVAAVGNALLNLAFSLVPLLLIMIVTGTPPRPTALLLPLPILIASLYSLGIGLMLSTVGLYFADILFIYRVVLTAWMYLTPIIYPVDILPEPLLSVLRLNPLYYVVGMFRDLLYLGQMPAIGVLVWSGAASIAVALLGWLVFTNKADDYPYRA